MSLIDQTLNTLGQDYFKQGMILVGNVTYANYQTDGTDDQVEIQQAVDEANGNDDIKEVVIVSDISVNANTDFNEVLGGNTRRIAVRLRDGVKITIAAGVTISFPSGGNSGGTFTAVFGNYGSLNNAEIVCEGDNAFDGLSTTAGTLGSRFGAVSVDARSNSCSSLQGNSFILSGTRTAGELFQGYSSDTGGNSIADSNYLEVLNADTCLGAGILSDKGKAWTVTLNDVRNSLGNGFEVKNAVIDSSVHVNSISGSVGEGLKIWVDSGTDLNELTVSVDLITTSTEHNIFIGGMNGSLTANVNSAQKGGIYFDDATGTLYSNKILLHNVVSKNNNQSGSTFAGIGGKAKYVQINGFDCSDDQGSPTQYRGIDFSDSVCDYIVLQGGYAENNTDTDIVIKGINSKVHKDVLNWNNTKTIAVSGSHTIDGPEEIYLLNNNAILNLPLLGTYDSNLTALYTVACISGVATLAPNVSDSLGNLSAGTSVMYSAGQAVDVLKTSTKWELIGDSSATVASINTLETVSDSITTDTLYYKVDAAAGDFALSIPEASTWIGRTMVFHNITDNFNTLTLNRSGSDVIQKYGEVNNPPTATSINMGVPNMTLELTATETGVIRVKETYDLSFLREIAYKVAPSQVLSGTSPVLAIWQVDTLFDNSINAIYTNYEFDITTYAFTAPCDMVWHTEARVRAQTSSPSTRHYWDVNLQIDRGSGYVSEGYGSPQQSLSSDVGALQSSISTIVRLNKGDKMRVQVRSFLTSVNLTLNSETTVSTTTPDLSYFKVTAIKPL
jgi:hypothetical protein